MKIFISTIISLIISFSLFSQTDKYVVQVAAFDRSVDLNYFKGLVGIYHYEDHNGIHKYYKGNFNDKVSADIEARAIRNFGFNAYAVNLDAQRRACSNSCSAPIPTGKPLKLKSIFFDFDLANLRLESMDQLNLLYSILEKNPGYNTHLNAHTDSKGSNDYNDALSMRRALAAKNYLVRKGIAPERIKTNTFGEEDPIAKNQSIGGEDLARGRQFNRRVELVVYQANGEIDPVVEAIRVPSSLQNEMFARRE